MCIRIHLVHGACEPRLVHRREKRMDTFALYRVLYRPVPDAYRYTPYLHAPRRLTRRYRPTTARARTRAVYGAAISAANSQLTCKRSTTQHDKRTIATMSTLLLPTGSPIRSVVTAKGQAIDTIISVCTSRSKPGPTRRITKSPPNAQ